MRWAWRFRESILTFVGAHLRNVRYRRDVDVEVVGTGDVWLGLDALEVRLADEVGSVSREAVRSRSEGSVRYGSPRGGRGVSGAIVTGVLVWRAVWSAFGKATHVLSCHVALRCDRGGLRVSSGSVFAGR